jgi:TIR domain
MAPVTKDIFVGYAEGDRSRAQPLLAAGRKAGLSVTAAIFDGISRCDEILQRPFERTSCFVVLWSQAAASSPIGKELANHAIQAWWLNRLVLLTLDDTPLPSGLRDVPITPLRGTSAADIAEPMARIKEIVDENSSRLSVVRNWKIAASVAIICGAGFWLYRHRLAKLSSTPVSKDTQPAVGSSSQVFVSYSRADSDVVDHLVAQIKQLGYTVWIDREETSSQRYAATIVGAIRKARLVALMCSRHSLTSDQVVREVYVAGDYKKPFVIFQLDSAQFPDEFVYFLSGYPRIIAANLDTARLRSQIEKAIV